MTVVYKSSQEIEDYKNTKSSFVDYTRFEGNADYREAQKQAFINNEEYTPDYDYDKLDHFIDETVVTDRKTKIYEAVLELDAAKEAPDADPAELELYRSFLELRLKKIMLVEAARNLRIAGTSSAMETAREAFLQINEETYGELNTTTFNGMMTTEFSRAVAFEPKNDGAQNLQSELLELLGVGDIEDTPELPLMTIEDLKAVHDALMERYKTILDVVPDTDDATYYNADACMAIMNLALEAGGLAQEGWYAVIDPAKSNPSTNAEAKKINLPKNTRRNAAELRRLILHEQEVHARRGHNGQLTEFGPLAGGTADYADAEEGLGVFFESALVGNFDNPSFNRARDRYITAGLAMGIDGENSRDARQVYDVLWRMFALRSAHDGIVTEDKILEAKNMAYGHVENAFRGTPFWRQGVIYTKLKVYYEGLQKNAQYFHDHKDDINGAIDVAMLGKYNHTDAHEYDLITTSLRSKTEKDI